MVDSLNLRFITPAIRAIESYLNRTSLSCYLGSSFENLPSANGAICEWPLLGLLISVVDCSLEQCADPGVLAQLIKFIVSPVCAPGLHLVLNSGAAKCERNAI